MCKDKQKVVDLLSERYGITLADVDEDMVDSDLDDGDDPEYIVYVIGLKYDLNRIDQDCEMGVS